MIGINGPGVMPSAASAFTQTESVPVRRRLAAITGPRHWIHWMWGDMATRRPKLGIERRGYEALYRVDVRLHAKPCQSVLNATLRNGPIAGAPPRW